MWWPGIALAATVAAIGLLLDGLRLRARVRRARAAERRAEERRDRFLIEAAGELKAPLERLRGELVAAHVPLASLDELRAAVDALARLPSLPAEAREELDVGELVREVLAEPPFSDAGPAVMLRAQPARVIGDRERLLNGLRVLLWVVRREARELVVTVSSDEGRTRVEIDTDGARSLVDAVAQLPAVAYGLAPSTAPPGATLALLVAGEVARAHGGRVAAAPRDRGERLLIELPQPAT
jgi:hypothetical protein